MQEIFYEESSKCQNEKSEKVKYTIFFVLSILSFFLSLLWFFIIIYFLVIDENFFVKLLIFLIPLIVFLTSGILFFNIKNKFCIDYDYSFISGTIRISKVINNSLRKKLYDFTTKTIEKVGCVDSTLYNEYLKNNTIKKVYLTSNDNSSEGKDFYYILINSNAEKELLIIECTKTFIINVLKFSKPTVRDNELKWYI